MADITKKIYYWQKRYNIKEILEIQLSEITKAPYRAEVKEKPYWHFYITKQET